jgi:vacuolar-type H+-ATPase catalytic subunit A/Vma1
MIGHPAGSGFAVPAKTLSKAGNGCSVVVLACGNRAASILDVIATGLAARA